MINFKLFLGILILFLTFYLGILSSAKAQNVDIGVYPPVMQVETTPPANVKSQFTLENRGAASVTLNIQIKPFRPAQSNDGQVEILQTFQNFPDPLLANRIQIKEVGIPIKSVALAPKQKKTLDFQITVPQNEAKGDYYFTVLFVSNPETSIQSNSTLASAGIAMNVLMSVGPKGKTEGFISAFNSPFFVDKGPVHFNLQVSNTGENFFAPNGTIEIENALGKKSGTVKITPVNILAESQRVIPDTDFNKSFLLGPYKATVNLQIGDGESFSRSIYFFAFPASYAITILIVIGVITLILLRVKRNIE